MISTKNKAIIISDLEELVSKYFAENEGNIPLPYRGDSVHRLMAEAAFAVLEAVDNTESYLIESGLLVEDDE